MNTTSPWMTAENASRLLGVSRATLYAYVSRGFIRSQQRAGSSRQRVYAREDVERMRRRSEERRNPDTAAARALQWGMPILESSITLIDGARLYYRGHDAVSLSRSRSVAEVASLVWTGQFDTNFGSERSRVRQFDRTLPFVPRAQSALAAGSACDSRAFDLQAPSVVLTGWRILHLMTGAAVSSAQEARTIDETLARQWSLRARSAEIVRAALILCADHELNVSSFTARCVASAGSHPYAVVIAGLSALEGIRHGGASARVESMLASMRGVRSPERAIADRLRRGEPLHGFGHPLYRDGDPRARALLDMLQERHARSADLAFATAVANAAGAAAHSRPNLDFALATVARTLRLPEGSPLVLFAIGRTIGWIGHAIEQYAIDQLIRPRAKYVGVMPGV